MKYLDNARAILITVILFGAIFISSTSSALVNHTCDLELNYVGNYMRNNCTLDVYGEILTDGPVDYEEQIRLYNDTYGYYNYGSGPVYAEITSSDVEGLGLNDVSDTTSTFLSSTSSSGNPAYGAINSWEINYTWSADTFAYGLIGSHYAFRGKLKFLHIHLLLQEADPHRAILGHSPT